MNFRINYLIKHNKNPFTKRDWKYVSTCEIRKNYQISKT
jgi:hypothetical protein